MIKSFNLNFEIKNYINTKPHCIEFNDCTHIVIFADGSNEDKDDQKEESNTEGQIDIFNEKKTTSNDILEQEIIEDKKIITHKLKKMMLFKNTSLLDFKRIINSVCNCEVFDLNLVFNNKYGFSSKIPNMSFYDNYLNVGDNKIHLKTTNNIKMDYANQIVFYLPIYQKTLKYIKDLIKRASKKPNISLNYQINKLSLTYYTIKTDININLCDLFNLYNCKKLFKRVIIHDELLDNYTNKPLIQYVKQTVGFDLGLKHVEAKTNTLTLFYSKNITDNIIIDTINIFKDGSFKINLIITNDISIENILKIVMDYFNTSINGITEFQYLYDHLYINEVNSGLDTLTKDDYIVKVSDVNSIYSIQNSSITDINNLNKIFTFNEIKSRFKSNTSINFNHYNFLNESILYSFLREIQYNGHVIESNYKNKICPEVHYTLDSTKNLVLSCSRFSSFDEMLFALYFTLPLVKYTNLDVSELENETEISKNIIKRCQKISTKTNLKQLLAKDPVLFAPRTVDKKPRSYSALCQKQEQRPVLLNQQEYNIIREILPESVCDLQNQTFDNQRNYLFCPFEDFKFLNYHHFNGQKCIVRCTTKLSNQTQYNQCANELGAYTKSQFTNKYENNSIIFYNEYLSESRKCYPPTEFKKVLMDYILFSPTLRNEHITQYCARIYNTTPFVIKRDSINKFYYILSNFNERDYNKSMLCIQTENNPDKYMIFINVKDNKPLILNDKPELRDFFKSYFKNNTIHQNYIKFVCEHVLMDYSLNTKDRNALRSKIEVISKYNNINDFIEELKKKWNCQMVYKKNNLYGIIKKKDSIKYYYPTPIINQIIIDSSFIKTKTLLLDLYSKNILLPTFQSINPDYDIENNYDYVLVVDPTMDKTKYISGINFKTQIDDVLICCQNEELTNENMKDYIIVDTKIYYQMLFIDKKINIKVNSVFTQNENIIFYLENQLEKYIKKYPNYENLNFDENVKQFIKFIDNQNVYADENQFVYIGTNTISLIRSRINKKYMIDILNEKLISFNKDDINDFIYNKIIKSLNLSHETNEVILEKVFI